MAETQATLKAQVPGLCRLYYSQVWNKAFKQAGVEASSDQWMAERVYYPLAIKEDAPPPPLAPRLGMPQKRSRLQDPELLWQ